MIARRTRPFLLALAALALVLPPANAALQPRQAGSHQAARAAAPADTSAYVPAIGHVFVINIENKGYDKTWGDGSEAPYLAKTLRHRGVLLNSYYGTAHNSQPNYIAQISGQGPNQQMQFDCQMYSDFQSTGTAAPGQYLGSGCVFPEEVPSLPVQMTRKHLRWKGYMDDMGRSCRHPAPNTQDPTQHATSTNAYAVRHNPFVYFHAIIDRPEYCQRHVVGLARLTRDLRQETTTPNLAYITPDLCHDGHDAPCANGRPGGLKTVDNWMRTWVPRILDSPAFKKDGMLVITADEADTPQSDASACCGEGPAANSPQPGIVGMGGGRVGALVISKFTRGNTWSTTPYNHYSLLASLEEIFGLPKLGYAQQDGLDRFGLDVYNNGWNE